MIIKTQSLLFSICMFVSTRLAAMNGVTADEIGRSINGTGSRHTGVTPCLKRLGVAVCDDEEQLPKRRRICEKGQSPEIAENNNRKNKADLLPADAPRTQRRSLQQMAKPQKQRQTTAKGSAAAKCKKFVPAASLRRGNEPVQLGGQICRKGENLSILKQMLQAAGAHKDKVNAVDPLVRAEQYANFLSALPSSLGLGGDYTGKHLLRKHLLHHIATAGGAKNGRSRAVDVSHTPVSPGELGDISTYQLLDMFPDVGKHISDLELTMTPPKLSKILG